MRRWRLALRLVGVGFFIGGSIVSGTFLGFWLDGKLNTAPILTIVGMLLGIAVAAYGVYQMLLPLLGNGQNKENG